VMHVSIKKDLQNVNGSSIQSLTISSISLAAFFEALKALYLVILKSTRQLIPRRSFVTSRTYKSLTPAGGACFDTFGVAKPSIF
jgi:hypothetical protein